MLAVPLGGPPTQDEFDFDPHESGFGPVVYLLEATTGIERHTIAGLAQAGFADLDGDGLSDLWGEVRGELRAFRGESPRPGEHSASFTRRVPTVPGGPWSETQQLISMTTVLPTH